MTNHELLAAVRIWQENGTLAELAKGDDDSAILAQFAAAILEQPEIAWRHIDGRLEALKPLTQSKSVADSWKAKGWKVAPMFMLPPFPQPDDIQQRAERAAETVVQWLYEGRVSPTVKLMAINVEAIIKSVMRGKE